ncbi:MAG TPA: phasin superfamily protein [Desulfuromonadaceae bacterium]|jgi:polyhydroxyalkanoate synthesis regulator phasin
MVDFFEKTVMTAIGVAAITQKKAEELAAELKDRYKLSEEEGKHFVDRIQTLAKDSREKIRETAEIEVQKVIDRFGLVSREEFELLSKRVLELESKIQVDTKIVC